jgi:RNA polymerase sigma-70 factor (ECF subfamily)
MATNRLFHDVNIPEAMTVGAIPDQPAADDAKASELQEFERLVERHQRDVFRLCFAICGDQDRAADAAQRTWLSAWRARHSVRDEARFRGWLAVIAIREAKREVRGSRKLSLREVPASSVDPAAIEHIHNPGAAPDPDLAAALATLDPDDRALVTLRYVLGFDSFEIGRMTGRSASGTRARLARLLTKLRAELGDG